MNIRYLKLSLAMGLALGSSQVMALGLGQLQVKSGLNQPLVAEIPIFAAMPGELDNLDIRLASPEAFERVGLERPNYLTANLNFSIGKNARGQNVVLVTSTGKFVEPFLSFLIEANWGRGSVTKEYTALIDPPYIAKAIVRPMEAPTVAVAPVQYTPPPAPTLPPIVLKPEPEPVTLPAPVVANQSAPLIFEPVPAPQPMVEAPPPAQVPAEPEPMLAQPAPSYFPPAPPPQAPQNDPATTGSYGPVNTGKTLWSIAEEVRPDQSVTIKQMMVALLRANPEAFEGENVNKLKRGSVLRIPGRDEASILTSEQAAALIAEQSGSLRSERQPVPQPTETVADTAPEPVAPAPVVAKPKPKPVAVAKPTVASKPKARLEIVPPSSKSSGGKAIQSGASSAAGGAELRAELTQAREDIAVRDSEITELKSRLTDLESQQTDSQKLIEMKDSQLKALQDELGKREATPTVAPAPTETAKPVSTDVTTAPAASVTADPWYMNPMLHYGAGGLLLLGGLVWFFRRSKNKPEAEEPVVSRRISDDADLQASLTSLQDAKNVHQDKTAPAKVVNVGGVTTESVAASKPASKTPAEEPELVTLRNTVRSKPQDLEAHLSLLRYYYQRGDSKDFEAAAQTMRTHVNSAQDPRWREAVVMGVALLPGHALFNQAGWNVPKFESSAKPIPATPPPAAITKPEPSFLSKADLAELENLEAVAIVSEPVAEASTVIPADQIPAYEEPDEIMLMSESDFVALDNMPDIHRSESELMAVDAASSTKIELARAYLEIGDVEGARSMLEEVAASGSAPAKAMAQRIMTEIG